MKALTLYQPWASLVAVGAKTIETRGWATSYRGPLLIHAGKTTAAVHAPIWDECGRLAVDRGVAFVANGGPGFPNGALIARCRLADCIPILGVGEEPSIASFLDGEGNHPPFVGVRPNGLFIMGPSSGPFRGPSFRFIDEERPYGDFSPGRWAWLLADIKRLAEPIPARGRQGLWECAA